MLVSVLFTDLVDSTALAFRLGRDDADDMRQTHFGLLREAIGAAGGIEVKNLGDGLMVAFSSPSRALACAVGMQQSIERHNHRSSEPLAVRIGLSVGEAIEDDGDYFGDPVIEAARLCAAAAGGQILTSELVRAMVGRNAAQSLVPVGLLDLKGIPEPVAAVEVVWEPSAADNQVPLPARLVGSASEGLFGFFGRSEELDWLDSVQKACFTEPSLSTVLVSGEAGIGKTTVIAHSARTAHAAGATVLFGRCDEDLVVPYRPWIEALSHLLEHRGSETLATLNPVQRGSLNRLIPEVPAGEPNSALVDPDTERLVLLQAVSALLSAAAGETPLVVVLDDLHWADAASLQLLRHVVASAASVRLMIVATYRDTDLSRAHPLTSLLADLHREPGVSRLALHGLSDADIVALLAAAAGGELDDAAVGLAHALRRETDGNPFFTAELLRHLGETGAIYPGADGRWTMRGSLEDMTLPTSIRDVVARRVARLSEEAGRALSIAAVIGRDFDADLLGTIAERDDDSILDLLDAATTAAVVVERDEAPGRYQFTHALIQHTLYQDVSAARRQRLHHRIAEALEQTSGDDARRVAQLAHHWIAATRPTDVDKALRYTLQAADAALRALAPHDALRWFEQALELVPRLTQPDQTVRCRILVGLGTAQRYAGDEASRSTLLDAAALAEELGDADLLVSAALANTRGWNSVYGGVDEERVAVLKWALARVTDPRSVNRARLLAVLCLEIYYAAPLTERLALAEEAVATARRADNPVWLADVLVRTHEAISMPQTLDLRVRWTSEAAAISDTVDRTLTPGSMGVYLYRCLSALEDADGESLRRTATQARDLVEMTKLPFTDFNMMFHSVWLAALDGDVARAEHLAEEALSLGLHAGQPDAFIVYGAQLVFVRWLQGRLPELVDAVAQNRVDNPGLDVYRALDCWVRAHAGLHDEVRAQLDSEVADAFPAYEDQHWLTAHILWAYSAALVGHHDAAVLLRSRLAPWHRQCGTTHVTFAGVVAHYLGMVDHMLGELDTADRWYAEALTLHERLASPVLVAWTKAAWAALLNDRDQRGDQDRAHKMVDDAMEQARRNGWGLVEQAAAQINDRG